MDNITLIVYDEITGSDVIFKVRRNTPLIKILEAYCDRMCIDIKGMKLMFGDLEICLSLNSFDYSFNDETCLFVKGKHVEKRYVPPNPSPPIETLDLFVNDVLFKVRTTTPLIKILETYCDRMNLPVVYYKLYNKTTQLNTNLTSRDYQLQNGTELTVR